MTLTPPAKIEQGLRAGYFFSFLMTSWGQGWGRKPCAGRAQIRKCIPHGHRRLLCSHTCSPQIQSLVEDIQTPEERAQSTGAPSVIWRNNRLCVI